MSPEDRQRITDRGVEWLFQQGVSTVLLFCILAVAGYAIHYEVPAHIEQLNEGNRERDESHGAQLRIVTEAYERDQQRDEAWRRELLDRQRLIIPRDAQLGAKP